MKEANPKLVAVFVMGGMLLIVAALILFSSRDMFTPKRMFYVYFLQSVNGLNIGSTVRFRGIPVGEVIDINGIYNPKDGSMMPRVVIKFLPETLENAVVKKGEYTLLPLLLKNGLRVNLRSTSLLTGQLYVAMDFHPEKPARFLGEKNDRYPELPTFESGLDLTIEKISELPLEQTLARIISSIESIERLLSYPGIKQSIDSFHTLVLDTDAALIDVQKFVNNDLRSDSDKFRQALTIIQNSVNNLTRNVTTVTDRLNTKSLLSIESTMAELQSTLVLVQQRMSQKDPVNYELRSALRELTKAARSARELTDYLKQHPEAVLQGKHEQ